MLTRIHTLPAVHRGVKTRTSTLAILFALVVWSFFVTNNPAAAQTPKTAKRPNILFLFADDMRADTIAALGNKYAKTPNLDKLVKRGLSFNRSYILGGNQGAVCVPSRAMLMSGKSMFTVPSDLKGVQTWPMILRRLGYRTFMTGKWHNGPASATASFPGAKSVFLGGMTDQFAVKIVDLPNADKMPKGFTPKQLQRTGQGHASEVFANEAIGFLKEKRDGPFALYVAFTAPHDPRSAPKRFHEMFKPGSVPSPKNFLPEHPFDNGEMKIRDEKLAPWPRTKGIVEEHLADYHAIISHLDEQIGRILQALAESGELENTIIIFAADNGLAIGSHGLFGKQNVYDHSVRVPLIIAGPDIPANQRTDAMMYSFDLCPTILELAGAPALKGIHGKSLVPVLRGQRTTHRPALTFSYRDIHLGVLDGRFKAIYYPKIERWQLFDHQTDQDEIHDISKVAEHAATLQRLRTLMSELRKDLGAK